MSVETCRRLTWAPRGFDLPKFKALMDLWQIVPACPKEAAKAALRTLRTTNQRGLLMFIIVCRCLIKGVEGGKEDLALDGSMEFYFVLAVSLIAAVGLWEMMKYVKNKSWLWWNARQRRIQRSERLRNRTRDAVQDELRRLQEELRRRELELTPRPSPTRTPPSTMSRRPSSSTARTAQMCGR